jgi:hypothetical protein
MVALATKTSSISNDRSLQNSRTDTTVVQGRVAAFAVRNVDHPSPFIRGTQQKKGRRWAAFQDTAE